MNVKWLNKKNLIKINTLMIVLIYIIFLYMDAISKGLGNTRSLYLKYSTILLCFALSLLIGSDCYNKRDKFLVWGARLFTVIADYYLVIRSDFSLGILCFCIVQIFYIIRHSFLAKVNLYKVLPATSVFMGLFIMMLLKIEVTNINKGVVLEAACYGSLLLCSFYTAYRTRKPVIALGMLLFFLCDMNVALYNITNTFASGFLIWLFYLPSQLLLTLSGFRYRYLK